MGKNARHRRTAFRAESRRNPPGVRVDSLVPDPDPDPDPVYVRSVVPSELVQRIRTAPHGANSATTDEKTKHLRKVLARVLGSLLDDERFITAADLLDAWKFRLARLHIRYHPDDLVAALRLIESKRPTLNPYGE